MEKCVNLVYLKGKIKEKPKYISDYNDLKLYTMKIEVPRLSGETDTLNLIFGNNKLFDYQVGDTIGVTGYFRSKNIQENNKSKVELYIFANKIEKPELVEHENFVLIRGYLCKIPTFRFTPSNRKISDLLVAVNRRDLESDYLPCIAWNRFAVYARDNLKVGDIVEIEGRVQSRTYKKRISESKFEQRIAYEISVSNLTKIEE